jgi:trimeric autotransporter adhesin
MTPLSSLRSGQGVRAVLAVVVLGVGVGVGLWGAQQSGTPPLRVATAGPGTVKEKVAEPATVDDVSQADVNSDISGDVESLDVQPGEEVYADETLATTDPYSDDATLYEESLGLNQDEAQLASDESDQSLQSAEAELATTQQDVSSDQTAATQQQDSLAALQTQDQAALQQDEVALAKAEDTSASDTGALTATQATASEDQVALETAEEQFAGAGCPQTPLGSSADCTTLAGAVTTAQSAVTSDADTLSSDQSAVEDDQQSVQDDQSTLLLTGLNDQSSLTQASAKYTTAEQALSVADASLANAQAAVSQSQRDVDVVTEVDAQRVTEVEAQIQSQKDSLKDDRLTAPISGTVKSVQIKPGMEVSSAPSELTPATKPPSAAIVIDSHGSLVAETNVDGASAASIHVGDPVQLALPQHPSVQGTVSSIGIISTDPTGAESAPVTIMISGEPPGVYPGLSAEANITLVQKTHVLSVPSDAVHTNGTQTFVDELINGRSVRHDVRLGAVGAEVTQIMSGLSDGTKVVVPG